MAEEYDDEMYDEDEAGDDEGGGGGGKWLFLTIALTSTFFVLFFFMYFVMIRNHEAPVSSLPNPVNSDSLARIDSVKADSLREILASDEDKELNDDLFSANDKLRILQIENSRRRKEIDYLWSEIYKLAQYQEAKESEEEALKNRTYNELVTAIKDSLRDAKEDSIRYERERLQQLAEKERQQELERQKADESLMASAKIYSAMKPTQAANILKQFDPKMAAKILSKIRERQSAKIIEAMPPAQAAQICKIMAYGAG